MAITALSICRSPRRRSLCHPNRRKAEYCAVRGIVSWIGLVSDFPAGIVESGWGMLSLTVPTLLLLLLVSALVRGAVSLSKLIASDG